MDAPADPSPLRVRIRDAALLLAGLAPLAYVTVFIIPKLEQMFKEMEFGDLPTSSCLLFLVANTAANFWYVVVAALAGVIGWGCQNVRRRDRLGVALAVVTGLAVAFITYALFQPLVDIMQRIGK